MKKFKWIQSAVEGLSAVTGKIASLCIFAAALIITEGVISRKIFNLSGIWEIELSVFLLIFSCFMGAPFVQKGENHLNVDLVLIHFSPKTQKIILVVVAMFSCILCALFAWYAWPMWWKVVIKNHHSESFWGPPLWIPYLFLPLGMTLMFLQYIVTIVRKINALKNDEQPETTD